MNLVNDGPKAREQSNGPKALVPENKLSARTGALAPPMRLIRKSATLCLTHTRDTARRTTAKTRTQDGVSRIF
jgi:hypothetical protein